MKNKIEGVTLIALVVTIVVLLIIAGISINMITSDNGIIDKSQSAKGETEKASEQEVLEVSVIQAMELDRQGKIQYDNLKKELDNNIGNQKYSLIENYDGFIVTFTKSSRKYVIDEDGNIKEYEKSDTDTPDLQEKYFEFTITPSTLTKEDVKVEAKSKLGGYTLQYSLDKIDWKEYSLPITMEQNGEIYFRLWNGNTAGGYLVKKVNNIDKVAPNNFTPETTSTSNSITITGKTTDAEETETNACSGLKEYYFSKDNGKTWQQNADKLKNTYTYTGLTQNTTYSLKMKVIDQAGNEVITNMVSQKTGTVTGLNSSNVTFSYNPSTATNGNVEVTISTGISEYQLQYSKDTQSWKSYIEPITMTDNGAIYARLWDGTNAGDYATGNVTNIDRVAPEIEINITNSGECDIYVSVTAKNKTAIDGTIKFKYYIKLASEPDSAYKLKYEGTNSNYNYTDLEPFGSYMLKVEAIDEAGNVGIATKTAGTSCFLAGTKVLTETGMKNIEDIQIGEKVYSINIDTNERELKEVTNLFRGKTDETYELTVGDEVIKTTPKHQFYIVDKGWIRAYEIQEGDRIVAKDNENMIITKIEHKFHENPIPVYNLTVDGYHNYLITQYELLVHNAGSRY